MADETAGDSMDQNETTDNETDAVETPRAFSQQDVDRIVQDRLARDRRDRPSDTEIQQLREAQSRLSEIEAANKSELEKEREAREAAEKRATELDARAREISLRASIIAEAARPDRRVVDPDAVVALIDRTSLELDDDGVPTNIASAMDSLLESRPYLVAQEPGARGNADQGARKGGSKQLSRADLQSMSPEAIVAARKEGRLEGVRKGS
jgi:hypothetical protein